MKLLLLVLLVLTINNRSIEAAAFLSSPNNTWARHRYTATHLHKNKNKNTSINSILILDHININHEKGRHDLLKGFYFDLLGCAVDPRKQENLVKGEKTLWANIGPCQFHLPEGKPKAQVFDGVITLAYTDTSVVVERYNSNNETFSRLFEGTQFSLTRNDSDDTTLNIVGPWGNQFRIIQSDVIDNRGSQPGEVSLGLGMPDLTINIPKGANFEGIARFYEHVFGAKSQLLENGCVVDVGPYQTLTFFQVDSESVHHTELVDEQEGVSNFGAHISMYVSDIKAAYENAAKLNLTYVNPRFKRRAYSLEEAVDQCMFRCLDIVDPEDVESGSILKIEHEIRSVVKKDGSKYKSCPFNEIPSSCYHDI